MYYIYNYIEYVYSKKYNQWKKVNGFFGYLYYFGNYSFYYSIIYNKKSSNKYRGAKKTYTTKKY